MSFARSVRPNFRKNCMRATRGHGVYLRTGALVFSNGLEDVFCATALSRTN